MSSSVDDAVLDYFSLLLEEENNEVGNDASLFDVPRFKNLQGAVQIRTEKSFSVIDRKAISHDKFDLSLIDSPKQCTQQQSEQNTLLQILAKSENTNVEIKALNPHLDKQALEQLLEPILKSEPVVNTATIKKSERSGIETKLTEKVQVKSLIQESQASKQAEKSDFETKFGEIRPKVTKNLLETLDDEFQVLFFKVAGLTLAVPLISLGGIVKLEKLNHIMGRPSWYKGVQTHRDSQLNVVDTCAWVMPEKYNDTLAESVNYQYVVLLEDSNWGLTCESLVNSVKIMKSDVNWRNKAGKRPWLAGVVKEQMCGILHVHSLIELLNSGLGSQDPVG
ncbi:chemotaxis protein CheW [Shewanella sp. VB17]|uniref:chemotaxis protein CheW n=1 Tax=Shewanella sp. VB17 TaxID=2739432 RepID=UPI00156748C0|nr:chemotaxis protein CheW [Shewanella sp. VB17]NRD73367.1 chemotaxis protein CheW [Shewanella sp. VB17]